jgi:hypothetical protein
MEEEAVIEDMSEGERRLAGGVEGGEFHPHAHAWREREMRGNQAGRLRRVLAPGEEGAG